MSNTVCCVKVVSPNISQVEKEKFLDDIKKIGYEIASGSEFDGFY